ncbi:MAG: hypothetical protein ACJ76N_16390 [Thermoanaerobaculia bacterium]
MDQQQFLELVEYYNSNKSRDSFRDAIRSQLAVVALQDLLGAEEGWENTLTGSDFEKLEEYASQIVRYAADVDRAHDDRLGRLFAFTIGLAGFSVAYIAAVLNLRNQNLTPTLWGVIIFLLTCSTVWFIAVLAVDPYYSHRRFGWSPYYFKYNMGQPFHKPRLLAGRKGSLSRSQTLADQAFVLDRASYVKRLLASCGDSKGRFLANSEQAIMLFHVTATKSWSLKIIQYVLVMGLLAGGAVYFVALMRVLL